MSGPDVEQTGQPGGSAATTGLLSEDARLAVLSCINVIFDHFEAGDPPARAEAVAWVETVVTPFVRALVAAAEERGFDRGVRAAGSGPALAAVRAEAEWRGAEKERERLELWLRMLADETDRHGPGLRDLAADLRWAANRMAEELGIPS